MRDWSESGRRLGDYLAWNNQRQKDFAQRVGTQQGVISRIVAGKMRPGLDLAYAIEVETGGVVTTSSWAVRRSAKAEESAE